MNEIKSLQNKMKSSKILSICIPTFQRKTILEKTLKKLVESEKLVPGKIEVCISDNASTDGTFNMLKVYSKKYSFIKIRKNPKNFGFDNNLFASFRMAKGKYCWATGDDDPIIPKGIENFVKSLEQEKEYILGLSGVTESREFEKSECTSKEFSLQLIDLITNLSKNGKYKQDTNFLGGMSTYFFGCNEVKKSFKQLEGERHGWYHLALLFHILSNFKGNVLINKISPIERGEDGRSKKIYLPEEEFYLFIEKRSLALKELKIDHLLEKTFCKWINLRGNYIYLKNLVQLFMISNMIKKEQYPPLKKKIYMCEQKIKVKFPFFLIIPILKKLELIKIFRNSIGFIYKKVRPNYYLLMNDYLKGKILSNEEREGKLSILKN